ncbi:MAG: serine/threonine-protein kinase [Candidatus Sedimenticola sp. PURPLELP]
MNNQTGIKIPGYRIEKQIGRGGMASVYLATQSSLGRPVALKVLTDPETPQFFERFFNEGRYVARLNHNNLGAIYDIGQGEGFYYIAMEYLPGGDLKARLAQGIRPKTALKLLSQIAGCLSYVHSQGLVHRDIKPSNILFRSDGTPVLTDFGIAKLVQTDNDLTITGTVMGSPHYLSPELAQGVRKLDGRSDIYSLGVILYEMLTGRKPYPAESYAATLMAHIQQPVPTLPENFKHYQPLLDKMMAKKPDERFHTGGEVIKAIQDLLEQARKNKKKSHSSSHQSTPKKQPHSSAGKGTMLVIPLLAAIALAAWLLMPGSNQTTETPPSQPQQAAVAPAPVAEESAEEPEMIVDPVDEFIRIQASKESEEKTQQVSALLETARERYNNNKLSHPPGDSAKDYYYQALTLEPGNNRAKQGLEKIADRYAQFARKSLGDNRKLKAERYISQGLDISPGHPGLKKLKRELHTPARQPATTSKTQAEDIFDRLSPAD